jgi:hypothetical protein
MTRNRKILGLAPFVLAYFPAADVGTYLAGLGLTGLFYWTAWWLSDGFAAVQFGNNGTHSDPLKPEYRGGPQGYGLYVGGTRIG